MPYPDPLATVYLVYGSDLKGPFVMVLHYFQVGTFPADQDEATALANLIDNTVGASLKECLASDCEYVRTFVSLSDGGVVYTASNIDNAGTGAVESQSLPDYCAAVLQKRTAVGGKTGRGRWYIGCVPESGQDTGRVETGQTALYNSLGDAAIADASTAGGTWRAGHMSRKDVTVVPITSRFCTPNLGTRRKRLLRSF